MKPTVLFITCEHAVSYVPAQYTTLFDTDPTILLSPKAYDPGAQTVATALRMQLNCDYNESNVSRLLVDCSRSSTNLLCFSPYSRKLAAHERQVLLDDYSVS